MGSRPRTSAYALARTPNFQNLKFAAGSNEVEDCLHAAFAEDDIENDQLLRGLGEQRDQLAAKDKWLEELVEEWEGFLPLHEHGDIGLDRLTVTLKRERKVLAELTKAMDAARKGREEKKVNLYFFE